MIYCPRSPLIWQWRAQHPNNAWKWFIIWIKPWNKQKWCILHMKHLAGKNVHVGAFLQSAFCTTSKICDVDIYQLEETTDTGFSVGFPKPVLAISLVPACSLSCKLISFAYYYVLVNSCNLFYRVLQGYFTPIRAVVQGIIKLYWHLN